MQSPKYAVRSIDFAWYFDARVPQKGVAMALTKKASLRIKKIKDILTIQEHLSKDERLPVT